MLKDALEKGPGGLDTATFGVGSAKSLSSLFAEIRAGECVLERAPNGGPWTRLVQPVFVQLMSNGKVLVAASDLLSDSSTQRPRNMLLTQKTSPQDGGARVQGRLGEHV